MNINTWAKVVAKLIADTKSKQIVWKIQPKSEAKGMVAELMHPIEGFVAEYADKHFVLNKTLMNTKPRISVVDKTTGMELSFSQAVFVEDLYSVVKSQATGLDDFIERFLTDR